MKKALIIVAHPDDETIWIGGMVLKNPDWDWTILSLCRKEDPDRMPKFRKVCAEYGAKGIISDLDDEKLEPLTSDEIIDNIEANLSDREYDMILTHGENGEYGHIRHKEIHKAVLEMINNNKLKAGEVYCFSYILSEKSTPGIPDLKLPIPKETELVITLTDDEHNKKQAIIHEMYGFTKDSFEYLSCNAKEALLKIK